jgi:hypothetical protein
MIYKDTTAIEAVNRGADVPDAFYDPKHPSVLMATSKWHSSDGWRGYNVLTPEPGFKLIDKDWATGEWGDAMSDEHGPSAQERKYEELEAKHGDIFVVYTPTSNVFSTGQDILVRDTATPVNKGKLIATKTRRFDEPDGSFRVRYHATYVVSYDAKTNTYTLDTGGWHTMTTAKRMTEALPHGWFVARRNWILYLFQAGKVPIQLTDGPMEVPA